jgi:hypothetical protein
MSLVVDGRSVPPSFINYLLHGYFYRRDPKLLLSSNCRGVSSHND